MQSHSQLLTDETCSILLAGGRVHCQLTDVLFGLRKENERIVPAGNDFISPFNKPSPLNSSYLEDDDINLWREETKECDVGAERNRYAKRRYLNLE